ncbi:DUF1207 domain-containing protein [Verrucomicrobiota bacterium]
MKVSAAGLALLFIASAATPPLAADPEQPVYDEGGEWQGRYRPYFDPILAEPRAALMKFMIGSIDEYNFAENTGSRLGMDISVGKEIPAIGYDGESDNGAKWGVGLWAPVGWHMLWDLEESSLPIVNNDYQFGGMIKSHMSLNGKDYFGLRLYAGHESTHLGDELTLRGSATVDDFERINVSYEFWDVALGYEKRESNERKWAARIGVKGLIKPSKGFYSSDPSETDGREIPGSSEHLEPYLGFEFRSHEALFKDTKYRGSYLRNIFGSQAPFISVDLRYNVLFDYQRSRENEDEDHRLSVNILAGLWEAKKKGEESRLPTVCIRLYHGVNPHGQFRDQDDYTMIGLAFVTQ